MMVVTKEVLPLQVQAAITSKAIEDASFSKHHKLYRNAWHRYATGRSYRN
jgi:hypothetical protein